MNDKRTEAPYTNRGLEISSKYPISILLSDFPPLRLP